MRTVFLAGGIGSGKSTVARELERRGAVRIDLDQLSRDVLQPGMPATQAVAEAFGFDLIDSETGMLDRALLARRAFATAEDAALLESIELPFIRDLLRDRLAAIQAAQDAPELCVVEVPLLDRAWDMRGLVDEVLLVECPLALRRERAIGRGMTPEDFDARAANQPDDAWLSAHADSVLHNSGDLAALLEQLEPWLSDRRLEGLLR